MSKVGVLNSLEISGFKSFGARKNMKFEDGITAIVGPNGSGKSNVADALRWVLGEQRTSRLRGGKSEELIFHGTDGKAQASLAEVSIVLNNSNNKFAISSGELEITRQLYRSGESDYRLNGRRVNYSKVEELLAQAGIGKNSYAVISQGAIELLLTAGGSERKMLFDEAAGIRQFDIKRTVAKRKLATAQTDLEKVSAIITELEPNQKILIKQLEIVNKRENLQKEYQQLCINYSAYWQTQYSKQKAELNKKIKSSQAKLEDLETELASTRKINQTSQNSDNLQTINKIRHSLKEREKIKAKTVSELFELNAQISNLQNQTVSYSDSEFSKLNTMLKNSQTSKLELQKKLSIISNKVNKYDNEVSDINNRLKTISDKLNATRKDLEKNQKKEFLHHANGLITTVRTQLRNSTPRPEIDRSMDRLSNMIKASLSDNSSELAIIIGKLQIQISNCMAEREEIIEIQTKDVIQQRSLELDLLAIENTCQNLKNEISNAKKLSKEQIEINKQIDKNIFKRDLINHRIDKLDQEITKYQTKINSLTIAIQATSNSDTFDKFEEIVNAKKTVEWQLQTDKQRLSEVDQAIKELNLLIKSWFGKKVPKLPVIKNPVSIEAIKQLESEISAIDQIDNDIIEQAEEINNRILFLQAQKSDLESAILETEKFINKLETETKQKFLSNFEKINTQFQKYFTILFDGGVAKLQLTTKEEFGIDIITTPPGKRTQSVNALSGGEKALASVALLAAILYCNPSPFIFLDEVDAALDDNNSTRFNKILKDLANNSQIILITHNHETMQAAQNLFGITTSPKGDSEVLHIHLQQAEDLIKDSEIIKPVDKVESLK
jgi:chromosome segregation protein